MVAGAMKMRRTKTAVGATEAVRTASLLDTGKLGPEASRIRKFLLSRVIAQEEAVEAICECHQTFVAGLDAPGKPVASVFLLGPTGVGKTRVVEALAEAIHGSPKSMIKIDCGEYQMDHEVAKLIGAPPGYLGHRETQPVLSQAKLNASRSERSKLSIVLFDEVEKAAPSLWRVLLGVLDKGVLSLGDNTSVSFTDTIIFFTSNLGVKEINAMIAPGLGFSPGASVEEASSGQLALRINRVAEGAMGRAFPAEFLNRLDKQLVFHPLSPGDLRRVQDLELDAIQARINRSNPIQIVVDDLARDWLVTVNYDPKFGARQLKRQLERFLVRPLANIIESGQVLTGDVVEVSCNSEGLTFIKRDVGTDVEIGDGLDHSSSSLGPLPSEVLA